MSTCENYLVFTLCQHVKTIMSTCENDLCDNAATTNVIDN